MPLETEFTKPSMEGMGSFELGECWDCPAPAGEFLLVAVPVTLLLWLACYLIASRQSWARVLGGVGVSVLAVVQLGASLVYFRHGVSGSLTDPMVFVPFLGWFLVGFWAWASWYGARRIRRWVARRGEVGNPPDRGQRAL